MAEKSDETGIKSGLVLNLKETLQKPTKQEGSKQEPEMILFRSFFFVDISHISKHIFKSSFGNYDKYHRSCSS